MPLSNAHKRLIAQFYKDYLQANGEIAFVDFTFQSAATRKTAIETWLTARRDERQTLRDDLPNVNTSNQNLLDTEIALYNAAISNLP